MGFVAHDLGVDLGTSNTLVYVRHKGIVINEPTIVVVDSTNERKVRAVGDDAKIMLGRTTEDAMRSGVLYGHASMVDGPMREGVITDFDMTGILIQFFMRKAIGSSYLLRPRLFLSYPCSISAIERRAVGEAAKYAGARKVFLVEKPFAAALGCGLPVFEPNGCMVVDIGGGTSDIAVIKVEGTNFQPVVIGKSGSVQIGETVAAVGNPLGELTFSMSQGIVSCVNRAINVDGKPFNMIQVTAAINPGNSGGPLFNSYGEVIGIVSAKYSSYSNTTVEGIGFAIPIDDVLAMVKDIMTDGYVTNKPYIGITPQNMTAQMAQQYRYDVTQGVFVCSVEPGSAAEKAGLQMGDVITKIGDTAISDMNDLNAAKKSYRAGDTVTLTIYRAGGTKEVELTFDAVPQTQETAQDNSQQQQGGNNGGNGGYYYNPWDFFNSFFGNGYYGSSYSGESRDAA